MAADDLQTGDMSSALSGNIAKLRARAEREGASAPLGDRLSQAITCFVGSMLFVCVHLVLYLCWAIWNLGLLPFPRVDPQLIYLASEASVEAIFLSTFVLISQNRMAVISQRRADLDLHINLLAEHELTKLATVVARIAERVGAAEDDPEFHEIKRDVEPERILDALQKDEGSRG